MVDTNDHAVALSLVKIILHNKYTAFLHLYNSNSILSHFENFELCKISNISDYWKSVL